MTEQGMTFFSLDLARPGSDLNAETEFKLMPDGRVVVVAVRTWRHELELTANKPETVE